MYGNEITKEIFTELKESDDEKIRRWIIDDIRYNMSNEPLNNSEYKKKAEEYGTLAPAFIEGAEFTLNNQWISVDEDLPYNHKELIDWECYTTNVIVAGLNTETGRRFRYIYSMTKNKRGE